MNRSLFILLLLAYLPAARAQDTVYYQNPRLRVSTRQQCDYYGVFVTDPENNNTTETDFDTLDNKVAEKHYYIAGTEKVNFGEWKRWYPGGQLHETAHYVDGKRDGALITYWPDGKMKRNDVFQNDVCVSGTCYDSLGNKIPHFDYETKASFPGGDEAMYRFLKKKIYYPQTTYPVEGKVIARFIVTQDGAIRNIQTMNYTEKNMRNQVIHALKRMPRWEPARIDGVPVSVYYTLPVTFKEKEL